MALMNMTEIIVKERLEELLKEYDCCKCETCFMDMLALALNQIKPQYVNTKKGELLKRIDAVSKQNSVDIDIAIVKAIEIVRNSPHHENKEEE